MAMTTPRIGSMALAVLGAPAAVVFVTGCGSSDPIVIHPKAPDVATTQCPARRDPFLLARVEDKRGYADANNVGFTQTGMFNVKAPLETDRTAAKVLEDALRATLRHCSMAVESSDARQLAVDLMAMQISEQTGLTSETMTGDLRYEVIALDPAGTRVLTRIPVTGHAAHTSSIDTTDFAEQTVTEAIEDSLPSFLARLADLDAPQADSVIADGPSVVAATVPIRVSLRSLTADEERAKFGTTMADKQVLAVEVRVERIGGSHDLVFRRQDFRLTFAGGQTRYPLDPSKVRERNRYAIPMFAYAGIVPIYVGSMNTGAETKGLATTVEQTRLAAGDREILGTLFYDLEGTPGKPVRIDLSFEDLTTHASAMARAMLQDPAAR